MGEHRQTEGGLLGFQEAGLALDRVETFQQMYGVGYVVTDKLLIVSFTALPVHSST